MTGLSAPTGRGTLTRPQVLAAGVPCQIRRLPAGITSRVGRFRQTPGADSDSRTGLFAVSGTPVPAPELAAAYESAAAGPWTSGVLEKLGAGRGLIGLADRIGSSYPFHPDLMRLVSDEWSKVQGFQRVRSTVAIFARTAVYWAAEHAAGRSPPLIGVGDIPLTVAAEPVLGSGLLLGNDRAIQGFRAVTSTDITSADGSAGQAVTIDGQLRDDGVGLHQPAPAVRMATLPVPGLG
jgi:hypothetical protein